MTDITLAHLKKKTIMLQVIISGFNRLQKHTSAIYPVYARVTGIRLI